MRVFEKNSLSLSAVIISCPLIAFVRERIKADLFAKTTVLLFAPAFISLSSGLAKHAGLFLFIANTEKGHIVEV